MSEKIYIETEEEHSLCALYSKPNEDTAAVVERTLIIMSHGFPGHKSGNNDLFGDLDFLLNSKGYHTFRFDYHGCGESDGQQEEFCFQKANKNFQTVLNWAREKNYQRFVYIGDGLGATIAMMNMDEAITTLVLLWPVLNFKEYQEKAFQAQKLTAEELNEKGHLRRDHDMIGFDLIRELREGTCVEYLQSIDKPTLIMQGAKDEVIGVQHLELARTHIKAKRIEITIFQDGAEGLEKLNHRKSMFYHVQQFIEKYN